MSLLGEILRSYYAWLVLGWIIGTGVLVAAAGIALFGHRVYGAVAAPRLALVGGAAERTPVDDGGHRYEVAVENGGRRAATDCRATLRLAGTHPGSGAVIRVTRPLGWITDETEAGIDPDGLARSASIPAGGHRRLYLGHTTAVHYQFVFPEVAGASGEIVRAGPGIEEERRGDRGLSFRDLNGTAWETAHLELRPADAEPARFRIEFAAELAAQDPRLRFEEGGTGAEPAEDVAGSTEGDVGGERDRAT